MDLIAGKEVLVTGAGGFIGSTVVRTLNSQGARIRALLAAPGQDAVEPPPGISCARADIRDLAALCDLVRNVQIVVHLAGAASVSESFKTPIDYASAHVLGTATLLEACRRTGVRRIVHVSSAEVYGRPLSNPVREDHPMAPRSPYAAAKAGAEQFIQAFVRSYGLDAIILRPFSVYGPGLSFLSLIGNIVLQAGKQEAVSVGDLRPVRDYCYVADLADAIVRACEVRTDFCVLNIGSGRGTSVADLVHLILRIMGRTIEVREMSQRQRPEDSEIHCMISDSTQAYDVLGWRPRTTLESGLRETIEWVQRSSAS